MNIMKLLAKWICWRY